MSATVTPHNDASRNLFKSFARRHNAECKITDEFYPESAFPSWAEPKHEAEDLFSIGPVADADAKAKVKK